MESFLLLFLLGVALGGSFSGSDGPIVATKFGKVSEIALYKHLFCLQVQGFSTDEARVGWLYANL